MSALSKAAVAVLASVVSALGLVAAPVEFDFVAPESTVDPNPFSRELWARVALPSGREVNLPAYYAEGAVFAVRVRPDEVGTYRFIAASESTRGVVAHDLVVSMASPREQVVSTRVRLPAVAVDTANRRRFIRSDGRPFIPFGANLAWRPDGAGDPVAYYKGAFAAFSGADLNWMRVWMAHWGALDLSWLPRDMGPSPRVGTLSEDVARNWDAIIDSAESSGVYVQVVLQHHGQYTTFNDSDWAGNPWNAANPGGFLKTPGAFFTDPNARLATLLKYRYIVARWGYSPAVFAWELFNEVHWTNSMRDGHEGDVAAWHDEMARFIRSVDAYGHPVTTSTEVLSSPVYAHLDYFQPHLYPRDPLTAARIFTVPPGRLPGPVFYGEEGGENTGLPADVLDAGLDIVPTVWASVMGSGSIPAQPWDAWKLMDQHRLAELGAVHRYVALSGAGAREDLEPFSARMECAMKLPLVIKPAQYWQRHPGVESDVPLDGTVALQVGTLSAIMAGKPGSVRDGYTDRDTLRVDYPKRATVRVDCDDIAKAGGSMRARVDGKVVGEHTWPAGSSPVGKPLEFTVPKGRHEIVLENPGPDWVRMSGIDMGLEQAALGSLGRRDDGFIALWVWNRAGLYEIREPAALTGTLLIDAVAAGRWKVTWWDTRVGKPMGESVVSHGGGELRIPTPPITRHAAVSLVRLP
jgi:Domain of unknown function (DUF5060)/Cellulase (glycosyl hydrolase family 5)